MEMEVHHTQFLSKTSEREIIKCPKCSSIYVDNDECESCGFRTNLNRLGDPLGEKSFYGIRENYLKEHTICGLSIPFLFHRSKSKKRYLRHLQHRFHILLDYFLSDSDSNDTRRRVFWAEFKTVIEEMVILGQLYSKILDKIENHSRYFEYRIVASEIINFLIDSSKIGLVKSSMFKRLVSYRLFNSIRVGTLFIAGTVFVALICFAISYSNYYHIVN